MRGRPYREGGEPWALSRNCGNSPVLVVLVSAIIYLPFTSIRWVGARPRCSGPPTRLLHCVPGHLTYTHFGFEQKDQADSTGHCYMHMVSLPGADPAVPGGHRHLPGSNQPAHTAQCRWPTESAPIKHLFKIGREIYFV